MAYVRVDGDTREALERALKRFGQRVTKEGILKELKKKEFYVPPAVRRRNKKIEARKRFMKNLKKKKAREDYSEGSKFVRTPRGHSSHGK